MKTRPASDYDSRNSSFVRHHEHTNARNGISKIEFEARIPNNCVSLSNVGNAISVIRRKLSMIDRAVDKSVQPVGR